MCKGATHLFFPPCTHYRRVEGTVCDLCGATVVRPAMTRPDGTTWTPAAADAICAQCPVRVDCLLHAIAECETHGIWGGAGGNTLRAMIRARHRSDHDYRPSCDCEACMLVTTHLTGGRVNANTPGARHGLRVTYARGCRCAACLFAVTATGKLLRAVNVDIPAWWAGLGLGGGTDPMRDVTAARQIVAARIATAVQARLGRLGRDVAWLTGRLEGEPFFTADRVHEIVDYQDPTRPFAPHLNPERATLLAEALDWTLDRLVDLS